jgi:uncharacterized membrane-anchored protein YitT (DUF2179 family)
MITKHTLKQIQKTLTVFWIIGLVLIPIFLIGLIWIDSALTIIKIIGTDLILSAGCWFFAESIQGTIKKSEEFPVIEMDKVKEQPVINGHPCSFSPSDLRYEIINMLEVNEFLVLPGTYTVEEHYHRIHGIINKVTRDRRI